jgi:hypothetical protein
VPYFLQGHADSKAIDSFKGILVAIWAVGAPVWFLWEFSRYTPPNAASSPNAETFDSFKHAQSLAKDLWIGFGAALAVLWHIPKIG